jgi:hypothetical protein
MGFIPGMRKPRKIVEGDQGVHFAHLRPALPDGSVRRS